MPLHLPVQAVVDRSAPLERAPFLETVIRDPAAMAPKVIEFLREPVGGPFGPDPNDPTLFPPLAGYGILSP